MPRSKVGGSAAIRPSVCLSHPCPWLKTMHFRDMATAEHYWKLHTGGRTSGLRGVAEPNVVGTGGGILFSRHRATPY